jgi:hypothetical protein
MIEFGIMLQFLVLCYGYLGDGMDNTTAVLLNVNDGPSPLQIGGDLNCLKSHDVMHCLDGDVTGQSHVDIRVEWQGVVGNRGMGQSQHSSSGSMMLYQGQLLMLWVDASVFY